jgi:hypothetical protein
MESMKKDDREWLVSIHDDLWEVHPGIPGRSYGHVSEKRNLTDLEWTRISTLMAEEDDIICSLGTYMGFHLIVDIYECEVYPGTGPKHLLRLGQKQIPVEGIGEATLGGAGESWKIAWDLLTKYTHSDRNAEKLKYHKMEAPREDVHYMY